MCYNDVAKGNTAKWQADPLALLSSMHFGQGAGQSGLTVIWARAFLRAAVWSLLTASCSALTSSSVFFLPSSTISLPAGLQHIPECVRC